MVGLVLVFRLVLVVKRSGRNRLIVDKVVAAVVVVMGALVVLLFIGLELLPEEISKLSSGSKPSVVIIVFSSGI